MHTNCAVSVIIPSCDRPDILRCCLQSLQAQSWLDFEVVVADNGHAPSDASAMCKEFPLVRWLKLTRHCGFAAAGNAGASVASGRWLAFLNDDTEPSRRWLEALMDAVNRNPEVAIFSSKLTSLRAPDLLDDVGTALTRGGHAFKVGYGEPDCGQYEEERYVFGACFAAALVRRDVFWAAGALDESFVTYQEDVDFCFRAQLMGHRCLYIPEAVVGHRGGGTTGGRRSAETIRLSTRNGIWVLAKNVPTALLTRFTPNIVLEWLKYFVVSLIRGQAIPYVRGTWEGVRRWGAFRRLGDTARRQAISSNRELESLMRQGERDVEAWQRRRTRGLLP